MSSTVPMKDSLNFLSDYYSDTKSLVAFTSPLVLYGEAIKRYPSLTFHQVKTWLRSKDTYTLHKPVHYNFPRNSVIVTGIDDQWQADLVDISSLACFNPISTGGGVFHINFVCLLITFLVLGRLPPNLVTFPKNYHSRGAWKKI